MPNPIDSAIKELQAAIRSGVVRKAHLARIARLRESTLTGIEDEDWDPRRKTLRRILAAYDKIKARPNQAAA